jgi:hypothetical protein
MYRIRSERLVGTTVSVFACGGTCFLLDKVSPSSAFVGLVAFPVLVIAREIFDLNRELRRAWRKARHSLPADLSQPLALRGTARAVDKQIAAPYSLQQCLAYRAHFTGTHFADEGTRDDPCYEMEDRAQIVDLVVECDGARVLVEGATTRLLFDPHRGEGAVLRPPYKPSADSGEVDVFQPMTSRMLQRARHQEQLLEVGDEAVVTGLLQPLDVDSPYRSASNATHRLVGGTKAPATLILNPDRVRRSDVAATKAIRRVNARPYVEDSRSDC